MSFDRLRRYRPAVFLAGDDIDIPFTIRVIRGLVVFGLAWLVTVLSYALVHRVFLGDPAAEAGALERFDARVAEARAEQPAEIPLPTLALHAEHADSEPWSYRRSVTIRTADGAELGDPFVLLEVRRAEPAWWMPTVRPVGR
ncbi:MAG: hypothetical protein AAGE94_14220 [Acidobacteriota bacterium]